MKLFPNFIYDEDGKTGFIGTTSSDPKIENIEIVDSVAIVAKSDNWHGVQENLERILASSIRNLRRGTYQFWIANYAQPFNRDRSIQFRINEIERTIDELVSTQPIRTLSKETTLVTEVDWQNSWIFLDALEVPAGIDHILDAMVSNYCNDKSQMIIQLGLAIERLKYDLWSALHQRSICSRNDFKESSNTKEPYHFFGDRLRKCLGTSFQSNFPAEFLIVKNIWTARGIVAHAKQEKLLKLSQHVQSVVSEVGSTEAITAAIRLEKYVKKEVSKLTHPSSAPI